MLSLQILLLLYLSEACDLPSSCFPHHYKIQWSPSKGLHLYMFSHAEVLLQASLHCSVPCYAERLS